MAVKQREPRVIGNDADLHLLAAAEDYDIFISGRNLWRPSGDFESMTDQEIKPYLGKAVRVTLADRRVIADVLHASDESGHGHRHYAIVSDAIREGGHVARELIHGGDRIATIENASGDPAATP
jgi:hypothetical protein